MFRRVGPGVVATVFALGAGIAQAASCGGPAKELGDGEPCFRASECQQGLVCVENKCTNNLGPINIHPEGGAGAGGAPTGAAGSGSMGGGGASGSNGAGGSNAGGAGPGAGGAAGSAGGAGGSGGTGGPAGSAGSSGSTGTAGGSPDASSD